MNFWVLGCVRNIVLSEHLYMSIRGAPPTVVGIGGNDRFHKQSTTI